MITGLRLIRFSENGILITASTGFGRRERMRRMYQSRLMNEHTDMLVEAILKLETREECYRLLEDLMTIREVEDLSQRMQVARLLTEKVTYTEITQKTGASSATIGRVNRALTYGADGYKLILRKLSCEEENK